MQAFSAYTDSNYIVHFGLHNSPSYILSPSFVYRWKMNLFGKEVEGRREPGERERENIKKAYIQV